MNQNPKGCGTQERRSALRVLHPPKGVPRAGWTKGNVLGLLKNAKHEQLPESCSGTKEIRIGSHVVLLLRLVTK